MYRTHGSAILISPYISDRHVNEKEKKNVAEKRAIGAKAASLIAQDDSIIIASGTTMAFLAREIKPVGHLTVITAAVPVTSILSQDANIDVIQLGGITRSSSVSVVGPFAEQMLRQWLYTFVGTDTHSNAYLDALQRARISKKVFDAVNVLKENNRTLF